MGYPSIDYCIPYWVILDQLFLSLRLQTVVYLVPLLPRNGSNLVHFMEIQIVSYFSWNQQQEYIDPMLALLLLVTILVTMNILVIKITCIVIQKHDPKDLMD